MTQIIWLKTKIIPLVLGGIGIYILWWFFLTTPYIDERFSFFIFFLKYIKYFLFFIILWATLVDYKKLFTDFNYDIFICFCIFFSAFFIGIGLYSCIYHILGNSDNTGLEQPISILIGGILGSIPTMIFLLSINNFLRKTNL